MALYHKWDVKNGFVFVLQFFSLISEGLGGVVVANANYSNVFDHALEIGLENRRLHFSRCLLLHYRAHYSQILIT